MFNKTQNLLRNLNFHTSLLKLFTIAKSIDLNDEKNRKYKDLFSS